MTQTPPVDNKLVFNPGEYLFKQGDSGGDLFFIEQGEVEILTVKDENEVVLTTMGRGEVLGVMTCLTNAPRMASARAKSPVACRKVLHQNILRALKTMPVWLKVVLKEYAGRLEQMNKNYSDAVMKIQQLEGNQSSNVYTAAQIASAVGILGEYIAYDVEGVKFVLVDALLDKLELALNFERKELEHIFNVMVDAGLIKPSIDPEKKKNVVKLEQIAKLTFFSQFVRESKHGSTKRYVRARFSNKETRVMAACVKFAGRLGMDLNANCRLLCADLEKSLERSTGIKYEEDALKKGLEMQLYEFQSEGNAKYLLMKPAQLGRLVACIEAVRKLSAKDGQADETELPDVTLQSA